MEDSRRRVWVLGAGFSRSLGGPLINDLLAFLPRHVAEALIPGQPMMEPKSRALLLERTMSIRALCALGCENGHWQNAEAFLEMLDTAVEDEKVAVQSHQRSLMSAMSRTPSSFKDTSFQFLTLTEAVRGARQSVLLDTWSFLRGAKEKIARGDLSERWSPYLGWAKSLTPNDTVVTFNYDEVPELLRSAGNGKLLVVRPHLIAPDLKQSQEEQCAPVLKLHGSTTWSLYDRAKISTTEPGQIPWQLTSLGGHPKPASDGHRKTGQMM